MIFYKNEKGILLGHQFRIATFESELLPHRHDWADLFQTTPYTAFWEDQQKQSLDRVQIKGLVRFNPADKTLTDIRQANGLEVTEFSGWSFL